MYKYIYIYIYLNIYILKIIHRLTRRYASSLRTYISNNIHTYAPVPMKQRKLAAVLVKLPTLTYFCELFPNEEDSLECIVSMKR